MPNETANPAKKLKELLTPLRIPISRIYKKEKADKFLTFRITGIEPREFYDNGNFILTYDIEINIFSKSDWADLHLDIIKILKGSEFRWQRTEEEQFIADFDLYTVPIKVEYSERVKIEE